jgi:carbon-monoxide dehydrogenase medium subunit
MKPAPFTYHDPRSITDAAALLAAHDNARVLAGGQSLMPMMNFRYAMPDHVIDLNRVAELSYIRIEGHALKIGAMTRQRDIEYSKDIATHCPVLLEALSHVGHRQTRNRGTIGGSLCHLDPSAELANIAALLDASLHIVSSRGERVLPFAGFATGYMSTALEADELLAAVTLPLPAVSAGHAFTEFARRHGDFSIVACSALLALNAQGEIAHAALAVSGITPTPVRPQAIEQALLGQRPVAETFKAAAAEAEKLEATSDAYVSAAYRQNLARVLVLRALTQAAGRART